LLYDLFSLRFPIGNLQWMADRPRLLPLEKEATSTSLGEPCWPQRAMLQRVLLATFSNTLSSSRPDACCPPFRHFDPFGTEFCEPGRISHPQKTFDF